MRQAIVLLLVLAALTGSALAADGEIDVSAARAVVAPNRSALLTMTVWNRTAAVQQWLSVITPDADGAKLQVPAIENGRQVDRQISTLTLAPGERVILSQGGSHIVLTGLKRPPKPGDQINLMLVFDKAGAIPVVAVVDAAGAPAAGG